MSQETGETYWSNLLFIEITSFKRRCTGTQGTRAGREFGDYTGIKSPGAIPLTWDSVITAAPRRGSNEPIKAAG